MSRILFDWRQFFFRPVSASGFGLMRIAWAVTVGTFFLFKINDVAFLYSQTGLLTPEVIHLAQYDTLWSMPLNLLDSPEMIFVVYFVFLALLCLMAIGLWTRVVTIASVLLLFAFHEHNTLILGGGDTVLRLIGFLLMIAPNIQAFSVDRLRKQWKHWRTHTALLPLPQQPIWPWRLVLWQLIVIYSVTVLDKLSGEMWWVGVATMTAVHHPDFQRLPKFLIDELSLIGPVVDYSILLYELLWFTLLIPQYAWSTVSRGRLSHHRVKRWLLGGGIVFHFCIWLFMRVGSFPQAMLAFYLGTLLDDDFRAFRRLFNRRFTGQIAVLYDGHCGLCRRSVFALALLDHLHRLKLVDFHNAAARQTAAPNLRFEDLDKALHIIEPSGEVLLGFDAFRRMARHLPVLWPLVPLLHVPGATPIGRRVYARVADRRRTCTHEDCAL